MRGKLLLVLLVAAVLSIDYREGTQISVRPGRNNVFTLACGTLSNNGTPSVAGVQPYSYTFVGVPYWMTVSGNSLSGIPSSSDKGPWDVTVLYRGSLFTDSAGSGKFQIVLDELTTQPQTAQPAAGAQTSGLQTTQPNTSTEPNPSDNTKQPNTSVIADTQPQRPAASTAEKKKNDPNAITYFEGSITDIGDPTARSYVLLVPVIGKAVVSKPIVLKPVQVSCSTEEFFLRQSAYDITDLQNKQKLLDSQISDTQQTLDRLKAQMGSVQQGLAEKRKANKQASDDLDLCKSRQT